MAHVTVRLTALVLLSLMLTITGTVMAQTTSAALIGTVKDESGGVLPGVTLTIRNLDTGQTRTTVTDTSGEYAVRDLPTGEYEVEAMLAGFGTAVRTGIQLTVGRQALVDLDLKVGELADKIVVTGDAPLVETASSTIRGLVGEQQIRDLPLNGRSFDQLALLQPGVVAFNYATPTQTAGAGAGQRFSVAGARPNSNNYLLDGTNINNALGGPGSIAGVNLGVEAVQEFEILTSVYDATFGRNVGGVVNIVSKSGTNRAHGSVFEFHRNSALDAANFFDRTGEPPPFKRNQYGFSLGGPLKRDKAFLFGNYEGLREDLGLSNVAFVPTAAARQGILPSGTVTVNPNVRPYLDLYPLPNGRDLGDGTGEFFSSPTRPTDEDYYTTRYDQNVSNASSFFVRYTLDDSERGLPDPIGVFPGENKARSQYLTAEYKHVFSSRMLNTGRFGYNRSKSTNDVVADAVAAPNVRPLSFVPGQQFGTLNFGANPFVAGSSVSRLGAPALTLFGWTSFQYMDDFSYVTGRQSLRAGVNIERVQLEVNQQSFSNGVYLFNSLSDFLVGQASRFQAFSPGSVTARDLRGTHYAVYVQDDFRWHPRVTLNLGLRYEGITTPEEINGTQARLVNRSDPQVTVGAPYFERPPGSFQPRVGLAWDLTGDGKTSVRAGFGRFADTLIGPYLGSAAVLVPPFTGIGTLIAPPAATFPAAFSLLTTGGLPSLVGASPDPHLPTRSQVNVSVQRELMPQTVVMIAYTGAWGRNEVRTAEANTAVPTIVNGEEFWAAGLPLRNRNFASVSQGLTDVDSSYNALQLSVNRRFHGGLQFQGSYTRGHAIDEGSVQTAIEGGNSSTSTSDYDNPAFDRGNSQFDVRDYMAINASYELPIGAGRRFMGDLSGWSNQLIGGWQVNAIWSAVSGTAFSALTGFNRSRNGDIRAPDRPDLVPGRDSNPVLGGPIRYYDPTAFALPAAGTRGDLPRGSLIGPGLMTVDVGIVKDVVVGGARIQGRAEVFNLLNRANFGLPGINVFNPDGTINGAAGRIINTVTTARQIQFGLKMTF